ncbi:hypothetical protein TNCV_890941 [Trichonephila clavipes]|nr:hypothetical protein TNCV_890941 [Trichonephila clavipes]
MGNGRRRAAPIPRMKGENSRNRMRENVSNQENSRQNGEEDVPRNDRSIEAESAGGGREERRKAVGTAEAVNQGSDQAHKNPVSKDAVQGSEGNVVNRSVKNVFCRILCLCGHSRDKCRSEC